MVTDCEVPPIDAIFHHFVGSDQLCAMRVIQTAPLKPATTIDCTDGGYSSPVLFYYVNDSPQLTINSSAVATTPCSYNVVQIEFCNGTPGTYFRFYGTTGSTPTIGSVYLASPYGCGTIFADDGISPLSNGDSITFTEIPGGCIDLICNDDIRNEKGHICSTFVQMNKGATAIIMKNISLLK